MIKYWIHPSGFHWWLGLCSVCSANWSLPIFLRGENLVQVQFVDLFYSPLNCWILLILPQCYIFISESLSICFSLLSILLVWFFIYFYLFVVYIAATSEERNWIHATSQQGQRWWSCSWSLWILVLFVGYNSMNTRQDYLLESGIYFILLVQKY